MTDTENGVMEGLSKLSDLELDREIHAKTIRVDQLEAERRFGRGMSGKSWVAAYILQEMLWRECRSLNGLRAEKEKRALHAFAD